MSILNVENVSHDFGGRTILENASFRLLNGEHIGLVGANGEGKSTFLNIITGKIKGSLEITELHIDQSMMCTEHQEDVQDLLMITLNQMIKKINDEREDTVNKVTNGVDVSAFL